VSKCRHPDQSAAAAGSWIGAHWCDGDAERLLLRACASSLVEGLDLSRWSDLELLGLLAAAVDGARLTEPGKELPPLPMFRLVPKRAAAASSSSSTSRPSRAAAHAGEPSPAATPDPGALSSDLDVAAQVGALKAAAQQGFPFVEECQRASPAQEPMP